ncbi:hypothetical protein KGM_208241A, partial [Danaus plexippus plexippus]
MQSEKKFIQI